MKQVTSAAVPRAQSEDALVAGPVTSAAIYNPMRSAASFRAGIWVQGTWPMCPNCNHMFFSMSGACASCHTPRFACGRHARFGCALCILPRPRLIGGPR